MKLIKVQDFTKAYRLGDVHLPILKGVSLTVEGGEMVALMGTSGSGKTTLMNILGCLDRQTGGTYLLQGEDVSRLSADERAYMRSRKIGFVFQSFNLLSRTGTLENVTMPLLYARKRHSEEEGRLQATELLERFGLGDRLQNEPSQLSGGQQQRVAIARALINEPNLLLADESTGNLDTRTGKEILAMLQYFNKAKCISILLVTHDGNVAAHAGRIIEIKDGMVVGGRPAS